LSGTTTFDPYHRWLGIPPKDQPPNHYRLLGIDRFESDQDVIRDAAEQRMAHVRTYQLGQFSELSQRILNELAAARACLLDPQKRAVYHERLRALNATGDDPIGGADSRPTRPPTLPVAKASQSYGAWRSTPPWFLATAVGGGTALLAVVVAVVFAHRTNPELPPGTHKTTISKIADKKATARSPDKPVAPAATKHDARQKKPAPRKLVAEPDVAENLPVVPQRIPPKRPKPYIPNDPDVDQEPPKRDSRPPQKMEEPSKAVEQLPTSIAEVREWLPTITLPSSSRLVVKEEMLTVPKNWQNTLFPRNGNRGSKGNVVPIMDNNDNVLAVVSHCGVKLNGPAVAVYPNRQLHTLAKVYSNDNLQGWVELWDEAGKPVFYGEYQHGRKHGVLCYFQNGIPRLIQAWEKGKRTSEYFVKWMKDGPRVLSPDQLAGDDTGNMNRAALDLAELDRNMRKNEKELKKNLKNWVASGANQWRRRHSLDKIHANSAAKAADMDGYWRKALNR
jgi:hypothetical protein